MKKPLKNDPNCLEYIPDYSLTEKMLKLNPNLRVNWASRKEQKAQILDELLPVAWHPDRDFDEDEKAVLSKSFVRKIK